MNPVTVKTENTKNKCNHSWTFYTHNIRSLMDEKNRVDKTDIII